MNATHVSSTGNTAVGLWLDPVCPFSWNTARWLVAASLDVGFAVEWHLMSLAVLNEGRQLPPPQQARMEDSRRIGRLMAAVHTELGGGGLAAAYSSFGEQYFDNGASVDDQLAARVLEVAGARVTTVSSMSDDSLDTVVRQSHEASQQALGETGGSPMLTLSGKTFFGPVLTSLPGIEAGRALFDAVAVLAAAPEFSQLQRPRAHA